ncbi:redox-regulated ATPase YchF [Candidatus Pelagibacter sp.]|nr:redox-regulated ATPase YchF [Candidatus Pelagibacter sp.]
MSLKCGIVGLPNVGKSTLFNALTNSSNAQAANFPFCTIDPNVGMVAVPDNRLENLAKISKSKKTINTTISFVDIAGLVKGASKGEGLGNKFLSHIREVDAIIHMIRCFDSSDIQNVNPDVDPVRDLEIIETEMMLADLESIQKRLGKNNKKNVDNEQLKILEAALDYINNDKDINLLKNEFEKNQLNQSGLLSLKPEIYVCNVDEQSIKNGNNYTKKFIEKFSLEKTLIISADIENQINELDISEKKNYMEMIGLKETGLNVLIQKGYKILGLDTFFTSGPEETRAWTIEKNCTAPKAAGEIHTDFEKGFIRAETISYSDFVTNEGWVNSKTNGKMRLEGKDYIVKDGDVLNFRFNT